MRMRTLIISLLAVFAVSAVASASAQSNFARCAKVRVKKTGKFEDANCTKEGGIKAYIKVPFGGKDINGHAEKSK